MGKSMKNKGNKLAKMSKSRKTRSRKKQSRKAKLMQNPWMLHVEETRKANPELQFKDVLKLAGKTYSKK
jgi:hypothetical protein